MPIHVSIVRTKTNLYDFQLLKEATIHFYCLLDESSFSDICTITELKEFN